MLTQSDIEIIEGIIDGRIGEKLKNMPTKDDFYKMMDKLFGEQETIRNEQTLSAHSQQDYEKRLEKLEKIHPKNKHAFAIAS